MESDLEYLGKYLTDPANSRNPPPVFDFAAGVQARSRILSARWLFLGAATQDIGTIALPKARSNHAPIGFLSALSPCRPEVTKRSPDTHKTTKQERGLGMHVSENPSGDGFRTFLQSDLVFRT